MTENNAAQAAEHHLHELLRLTQPWPNATIPCATVRSHVEQALSKLRAEGVQAGDDRAAFNERYEAICDRPITIRETAWRMWKAGRAALASAPVVAQQFTPAFPNGALPATRFHELWERAGKTRNADYTMLENLTWQVGQFADLVAREASAPVSLSDMERKSITGLIAVARAAFNVADDAEDDGDHIKVDRADAEALGAALDALEELPDDQPGYAMGPSNKAEWALRRVLVMESAPVAGEAQPVAWMRRDGGDCWTAANKRAVSAGGIPEKLLADEYTIPLTYTAPQASEAVRNAALEEAAHALWLMRSRPEFDPDESDKLLDRAMVNIRALKSQADKDGGDCAKGAGDVDDLIGALGQCRDAFPIPHIVGSSLDLLWQEAMSDPTAVPAYVKACAARAALSPTQPTEQGERDE